MITLIQDAICLSPVTFKRSCKAGRATRGNKPISTPSNIHPVKAAASANHWPLVNVLHFTHDVSEKGRPSAAPAAPAPA